jgi:hypothetical protein
VIGHCVPIPIQSGCDTTLVEKHPFGWRGAEQWRAYGKTDFRSGKDPESGRPYPTYGSPMPTHVAHRSFLGHAIALMCTPPSGFDLRVSWTSASILAIVLQLQLFFLRILCLSFWHASASSFSVAPYLSVSLCPNFRSRKSLRRSLDMKTIPPCSFDAWSSSAERSGIPNFPCSSVADSRTVVVRVVPQA